MIQGKKKKEESQDDTFKVSLNVKIGEKLIKSDIDEALFIPTVDKLNPTIIANMMTEIPSLHARWNFLYNEAVYEYDMLKTKSEVWFAKKAQEYRKDFERRDKRVTEKMIDEAIKVDPEFQILNDDLAEAKKNMKHILAQANGFGEKGEKIVNIASMMKWEAENLSGKGKTDKKYNHIRKEDQEDPIEDWPTT